MTCYLRISLWCCVYALAFLWTAVAQESPALASRQAASPSAAAASLPRVDEDYIHKQFGADFSLVSFSQPFVRDIDGDGVDDLVIAAQSKKPMLDAGEHNYRVIDPYYTFYGYGDPKLTSTFGSSDLQTKNLVVLVICGYGPEAWHAETPKAKYVMINLPFKNLSVRRLQLRKKLVNAIFAEEADSTSADSVVFWDGKQFKYQPIGMGGADD